MGSRSPTRGKNPRKASIRLLPSDLVDQIAAGEVVERPASVLKELVENALDAGAERIRVEVRDGGSALIAVSDDGLGMTPAEAKLAIRRHATSKIASQEDLDRILSFGFRGEALPAIASVSRMRILTRPHGAEVGYEIRIDGGRLEREHEAGCPNGTRIEVADLFAQIPARRKFLKKPATEWGHSIDWLGRLAMALPGIHFEVQRDDHEAVVWPRTPNPADRIAAVLGQSQATSLVRMEWEEGAGHLEGYFSGPETSRANGNSIYLYVNGRPVRDKLLRHALMASYRDLLPRGRFPLAVVFITVPPDSVDVNVHPAKWEVRFEQPQAVHQLVRHAVREAMGGREFLAEPPAGTGPATHREPSRAAPRQAAWPPASRAGSSGESDWLFAQKAGEGGPDRVGDGPGDEPERADEEGRVLFGHLRLLGQVRARYLVLEGEDGLVLVDQHAAHERIVYERLRGEWLNRKIERQGLLVPETLEIGPAGLATLGRAADMVAELGFDVEEFGDSAVVIRAIPALLSGKEPGQLVTELIDELGQLDVIPGKGVSQTRALAAADHLFATLACHSARRFGDLLPEAEQRAILEGLDEIPWAPTCPHGRPVAAFLGISELDGRFGRH